MKPQEDIGSFIKTKLQSAEKASKEDTWDRIQSSLEKRKKKKRVIFFLKWSSVIALLVISGLLIVYSNSTTSSIETTVNPESETGTLTAPLKSEDVSTLSDKEETSTLQVFQEDTFNSDDTQNTHPEKDNTSQEGIVTSKTKATTLNEEKSNSIETIKKQSGEITSTTSEFSKNDISNQDITQKKSTTSKNTKEQTTSNTINQDTIVNRNDVPVTHTTKKIYYYYNSKNGQEISSTKKSVIDSIVKANEPKKDSLKMN